MKVLVLSNMSPKISAPLQGLFVDNQVQRLQEVDKEIDYYKMKWNSDSLLCKLFKYPVFFLQFFIDIIFSRKEYALIHVHFYYPTIILAACYKVFRNSSVKITVTCHGSDVYLYSSPNVIYRKLSNWVDHWVFTSEQLRERFFKHVEPSSVLCAGYDDRIFMPRQIREEKKYDFIQIGTLNYNKGIDRFLYLVDKFPNKQFLLIGEGPLKSTIITASERYSNLVYMAKQPPVHLANYIHESKFLLSLSRNESFGLTITEAHACGVPCIATVTDGSLAQINDEPRLVSQVDMTEQAVLNSLESVIRNVSSKNDSDYAQLSSVVINETAEFSLTYIAKKTLDQYANQLGMNSDAE